MGLRATGRLQDSRRKEPQRLSKPDFQRKKIHSFWQSYSYNCLNTKTYSRDLIVRYRRYWKAALRWVSLRLEVSGYHAANENLQRFGAIFG